MAWDLIIWRGENGEEQLAVRRASFEYVNDPGFLVALPAKRVLEEIQHVLKTGIGTGCDGDDRVAPPAILPERR